MISGRGEFFDATEYHVIVKCGSSSTIFTNPIFTPTSTDIYYHMFYPSKIYVTNNFVSSTAPCPLQSLAIVPLVGGTVSDYTSDDGVTIVTI